MASYHLSVKTISRSAGRSATAAAAYRTGSRIVDERTGQIHDYSGKAVVSVDLVLPPDARAWAHDRATLWNAAEQAETRKNSTVAREFEIALPAELSEAERRRLALDFAREIVERHGCAVEVSIHAPGREGDQRNHHAHLLCSTRKLEPQGFTVKTRELDDPKSGEVARWRARFAELQNERLQALGIEAQVDHRSLEAQAITEREPTQHRGPAITGILRRGETSQVQQRRQAEANARLYAARELGLLERELAETGQQLVDTQTALAQALREREERGREAERPQGRERSGPALNSARFKAKPAMTTRAPRPDSLEAIAAALSPIDRSAPIEQQAEAFMKAAQALATWRQTKLLQIQERAWARYQRRDRAARDATQALHAGQPSGPLAWLKHHAHEARVQAHQCAWGLAEQAQGLSYWLRDQAEATAVKTWTWTRLAQAVPELTERVQAHRAEVERQKRERVLETLKQDRGMGPRNGRGRGRG